MKFWKQTLITTFIFALTAAAVVYTSCEKDPCTNVKCQNGGSCGNGKCRCPTGYENTTCQTPAVARYLGVYAGFTYVNYLNASHIPNTTQELIDTAWVWQDNRGILTVVVLQKSAIRDTIHGYVTNNESTYSIIAPKDSIFDDVKTTSIMLESTNLQSNNELTIQSYETLITNPDTSGLDTTYIQSNFIGYKVSTTP